MVSSDEGQNNTSHKLLNVDSYLFYPMGSLWRQKHVIFISAMTHLWFTTDALSLESVSRRGGAALNSAFTLVPSSHHFSLIWDDLESHHSPSLPLAHTSCESFKNTHSDPCLILLATGVFNNFFLECMSLISSVRLGPDSLHTIVVLLWLLSEQ